MSYESPKTQVDKPNLAADTRGPQQGTGRQRETQAKPKVSKMFRIGAVGLGCFAVLTLVGGLTAGLLIPTINATGQSRAKARSAAGLVQLARAIGAYSQEHGSAPESRDALARLVPKYMDSYPVIGPEVSAEGVQVDVQSGEAWLRTSQFSYMALGDLSSLANAQTAMMLYEKPGLWKRGGGHVAYADGNVAYISGLKFDELVQGLEAAQGQGQPK